MLHVTVGTCFLVDLIAQMAITRRAIEWVIVSDCLIGGAWYMSAMLLHGRKGMRAPAYGTASTLVFLVLAIVQCVLEAASFGGREWFFQNHETTLQRVQLGLYALRATCSICALLFFSLALRSSRRPPGYMALAPDDASTNATPDKKEKPAATNSKTKTYKERQV